MSSLVGVGGVLVSHHGSLNPAHPQQVFHTLDDSFECAIPSPHLPLHLNDKTLNCEPLKGRALSDLSLILKA